MWFIEFPNLFGGLKLNINPVAINVFGIKIYWYGIIIAASFLTASLLALKSCRKYDIETQNILDLMLYVIPAGLIGARLYYVIFNYQQFQNNWTEIINIRTGGLAIYGALIGGGLACLLYAKRKKIAIFKLLDFLVPYIALAQAIGRWGNFVNQEAFGINTNLPWGMTGNMIKYQIVSRKYELLSHGMKVNPYLPVHPTFLYESIWNLFIALFLLWYRRKKDINGTIFLLYVILYSAGRFFIEWLRIDSLWLGSVRVSQLVSLVLIVCGIILFKLRKQLIYKVKL